MRTPGWVAGWVAGALLVGLATTAWFVAATRPAPPASVRDLHSGEHAPTGARVLPDEFSAPQRATEPLPLHATEPRPLQAPDAMPLEVSGSQLQTIEVQITASQVDVYRTWKRLPAAGATLDIGVTRDTTDLGATLRTVVTDEEGTARVELPWSAIEALGSAYCPFVWARSDGDGLLLRGGTAQAPEQPGDLVQLEVEVRPGAIVEGVLIGPDGEPTAGQVEWWWLSREEDVRTRYGRVGPDGHFLGELLMEGTYRLFAGGTSSPEVGGSAYLDREKLELGTGLSEPFEVRFGEPVPFLEVRVSGPGVIRGRVLDERGVASAGLELEAVLAELDGVQRSPRKPGSHAKQLPLRGGGHIAARAMTDGDGAFVFRGLLDDAFSVRAAPGNRGFGYSLLLTPEPVSSHGGLLELRLTRPHLAIHVTQANGSPPGADLAAHNMRSPESWPDNPTLLVTLAPESVHRSSSGYSPALPADAMGTGEFIVEVPEGVGVYVGVFGGTVPWAPRRVDVPIGAGRIDVDVVIPSEVPTGTLVLDVVDEAGTALAGNLRVRVIDPLSGVLLFQQISESGQPDDWPLRIDVPSGEYVLLVEGYPGNHPRSPTPRQHGAYETALQIAPGVETIVNAWLGSGAYLNVRLVGQVTDSDREAVSAALRQPDDEVVEHLAGFVTLRLEREGRWPELVDFTPRLELGGSGRSKLLSPGAYTLVAETEGGRTVRQPVVLVAGQTLELTLEFE